MQHADKSKANYQLTWIWANSDQIVISHEENVNSR